MITLSWAWCRNIPEMIFQFTAGHDTHSFGALFTLRGNLNQPVFETWEETGKPGGNPHWHSKNIVQHCPGWMLVPWHPFFILFFFILVLWLKSKYKICCALVILCLLLTTLNCSVESYIFGNRLYLFIIDYLLIALHIYFDIVWISLLWFGL